MFIRNPRCPSLGRSFCPFTETDVTTQQVTWSPGLSQTSVLAPRPQGLGTQIPVHSSSQGPARVLPGRDWGRGVESLILPPPSHARCMTHHEGRRYLGEEEFPDQRVPESSVLCARWGGIGRGGGCTLQKPKNTKNTDIDLPRRRNTC